MHEECMGKTQSNPISTHIKKQAHTPKMHET